MGYGEPEDVEGECNAHCYIGDNFGDNHATMRCQLPKGHELPHQEKFRKGTCVVTWMEDERDYSDPSVEEDEAAESEATG